jgi:hypothetical protein
MQNEEHIMCINDETKIDYIMEGRELIQAYKLKSMEFQENVMKRRLNTFCNNYKFKEKWHPHNINALCWYFYCVNDNYEG